MVKTLNARHFVRILSTTEFCDESIKIDSDFKSIHVQHLQDFSDKLPPTHGGKSRFWSFTTDGIFRNVCQGKVYADVMNGISSSLLDGVSAIVLSYGQTGAGKTFTMSGLRCQYENRGIILRFLEDFFMEKAKRSETHRISIKMSCIQIISEKVWDLLLPPTSPPVLSDKNISVVTADHEEDAWSRVFQAESCKKFSKEAPYAGASCGHFVLTVYVESESLADTDPGTIQAKIHLAELGGVDSVGNMTCQWKTNAEVGSCNTTKSFMEQLLLCLTSQKSARGLCGRRSTRFIRYLHQTFKPDSLLRFIGHIHGTADNLPMTLSCLRFGQKLQSLPLKSVTIHREVNPTRQLKILEREVERLQKELQVRSMLADAANHETMSEEHCQQVARAAEAYIQGHSDHLTLLSSEQLDLTLKTFRALYHQLEVEKEVAVKEAAERSAGGQQGPDEPISVDVLPVVSKSKKRRGSRQNGSLTSMRKQSSMTSAPVVESAYTVTSETSPGRVAKIREERTSIEAAVQMKKKSLSRITKGDILRQSSESATKHASDMSLTLPVQVPARNEAWNEFCFEMEDTVSELEGFVRDAADRVASQRRAYAKKLDELSQARENIAQWKSLLDDTQQTRHVAANNHGRWNNPPRYGNLEFSAMKQNLEEITWEADETLKDTHLAMETLKTCVDVFSAARNNLEVAFQNFCKARYKMVLSEDGIPNMTWSSTSSFDVISQTEVTEAHRYNVFYQLQTQL